MSDRKYVYAGLMVGLFQLNQRLNALATLGK